MSWLLRGAVLGLLIPTAVTTVSGCSPAQRTASVVPAASGSPLAVRTPVGASTTPAVPSSARPRPVTHDTSANWAGRVVTPAAGQPALAEASMRVTVPAVTCPPRQAAGKTSMVSVWTGLGGWHGDLLYQAGLEVTCAPGNPMPAYDAFYEVVRPGAGPIVDVVPHSVLTPLATHPIGAGDLLTVHVRRTEDTAGSSVRFSLADFVTGPERTPRWQQVIPVRVPASSAPPASAECIVERPSITDTTTGAVTLAPLPQFSPVFSGRDDGCSATGATGRTGLLGDDSDPWAETVVTMTGDDRTETLVAVGEDPAAGPLAVTWRRSA